MKCKLFEEDFARHVSFHLNVLSRRDKEVIDSKAYIDTNFYFHQFGI